MSSIREELTVQASSVCKELLPLRKLLPLREKVRELLPWHIAAREAAR